MTDLEQRAIRALADVRMPTKSWHWKQAEHLLGVLVLEPQRKLGITEAADLWFLVFRYRRQIPDVELVSHARELVTGAMSLAF